MHWVPAGWTQNPSVTAVHHGVEGIVSPNCSSRVRTPGSSEAKVTVTIFADVRSAHATKYSPLLWGGYGVHYMLLRGWAFNTGGSEGVLVETNHGNVMIGSRRAKELEAAITRAITERAGR